jgi:hypothetical protein
MAETKTGEEKLLPRHGWGKKATYIRNNNLQMGKCFCGSGVGGDSSEEQVAAGIGSNEWFPAL